MQYGITMDDYLEAMGTDRAEFEKQAEEYAREISKEQLVISAIAKAENITLSANEADNYYQSYADQYGADVEALKSSLNRETLEQYLLSQHVEDFIVENAAKK